MPPVTRNRFIGSRDRHTALRHRQQAFLSVLVDCCGSRVRAVEKSGIPRGTVLRWQSDPWFAERYREIRGTLSRDAQALRESLLSKALAMAFGERDGLLTLGGVCRIVDALDQVPRRAKLHRQPAPLPSLAESEARIRELLGK
jgi:hypothetical protein